MSAILWHGPVQPGLDLGPDWLAQAKADPPEAQAAYFKPAAPVEEAPDWLADMAPEDAEVIRKLEQGMSEKPAPAPTGPLSAIARSDEKFVRKWYANDAGDCAELLRLLAIELQAHAADFDKMPRRNMGAELHEARESLVAALATIGGSNPAYIETILRPQK